MLTTSVKELREFVFLANTLKIKPASVSPGPGGQGDQGLFHLVVFHHDLSQVQGDGRGFLI
jgi:hypothetical protein